MIDIILLRINGEKMKKEGNGGGKGMNSNFISNKKCFQFPTSFDVQDKSKRKGRYMEQS